MTNAMRNGPGLALGQVYLRILKVEGFIGFIFKYGNDRMFIVDTGLIHLNSR